MGDVQSRRVKIAERYIQARLAGRTSEILGLVSDDIRLESSRDGTFVGKKAFEKYLTKAKATGTWKQPTWNTKRNMAEITGHINILMVKIGVVAYLGFNRRGKINNISVGTKKRGE